MIEFYCGVNEKRWNRGPVVPGSHVCISPVHGKVSNEQHKNRVKIPIDSIVMQDSGAFSDGPDNRLDFYSALERQLQHADEFGYSGQVQYRASYDWLIDEVWENGVRRKKRWTVLDAEKAVQVTTDAAYWLSRNRSNIGLVLSAQGVDAKQYYDCAQKVLDCIDPQTDILGFGGWCIIGKMPKVMMPVFRKTILSCIPLAARHGIQKIHIWGVLYPHALGELLYVCDQYGILVSTDSSGPIYNPRVGNWGYGDWRSLSYKSAPLDKMWIHVVIHIKLVRCWLKHFRSTQYYKPPPKDIFQSTKAKIDHGQLSIFDFLPEETIS